MASDENEERYVNEGDDKALWLHKTLHSLLLSAFQPFVSSHHHDLLTRKSISLHDMFNTTGYVVFTTTSLKSWVQCKNRKGIGTWPECVTIEETNEYDEQMREQSRVTPHRTGVVITTLWERASRAFPLPAWFPVLVVAAAVVDRPISGLVPMSHRVGSGR